MRTNNFFSLSINSKLIVTLFVSVLFFASCSKDDDNNTDNAVPTPELIASEASTSVVAVPFFVRNENQEMPSSPDDLLYEVRQNNPLIAPDGHQLTWGEFSNLQGDIDVECYDNGTKVTLNMKGLIPYGQYTIWNAVFDAPGLDPTDAMLGVDGLGAAGKGDGSDNAFVASAMGEGSITLTSPGGDLSMIGSIGNCPLKEEFEWHVVGAYHMDGRAYGGDLGPDLTVAEHFGFIFKSGE